VTLQRWRILRGILGSSLKTTGPRFLAGALLLSACREPRSEQQARLTIPSASDSRPAAAARSAASPPPATSTTMCQWSWTASDDPSFIDCDPAPAQRDYPECFNYSVTVASGATGCPPSEVEITVSGGPGLLESHRARMEIGEREIRFLQNDEIIATASVENGKVTGFLAGKKLPAFRRGAVLKP
jgi:hypothetical protein